MEVSINDKSFLESLIHLITYNFNNKNCINIFMIQTNSNEFDYNSFANNLVEPLITYSLSRKVQKDYINQPGHLSKLARSKFIEYLDKSGELGELILYAFLETHLCAPKILSKVELKTSPNMPVHGSDGVHYLKLSNGNYQLIFCESKTIKSLNSAIKSALKSIKDLKYSNSVNTKSNNLSYEKTLVSENLLKECTSEEEIEFIKSIIYPNSSNNFHVDDAFGILVGYEIEFEEEFKYLSNEDFREKVKLKILNDTSNLVNTISLMLDEYALNGHNFYLYILPFSNLSNSREFILKEILS